MAYMECQYKSTPPVLRKQTSWTRGTDYWNQGGTVRLGLVFTCSPWSESLRVAFEAPPQVPGAESPLFRRRPFLKARAEQRRKRPGVNRKKNVCAVPLIAEREAFCGIVSLKQTTAPSRLTQSPQTSKFT